jgi:O-antigen/teichoic acid export membrane protein
LSTLPEQIDPLDGAASSPAEAPVLEDALGADEQTRHRIERSKRLKLSIFTSILIRPLAFVIPIVTIPLFIKYLASQERYGLYEAVGSVVMWLGLMNLGMSMGLINKLIDCNVRGDRETARLYVSTLTWAMVVALVVCVVGFSIVTLFVDWVAVFNISEPAARAEARLAVWIGGVLTLVWLVLSLPAAVYAGYQEMHRENYWTGAGRVLLLAACFVLAYAPPLAGLGVAGVLLAVSGVPALVRAVNVVTLFGHEKPWLRPSIRLFDGAALRVMLSHGINIFILQMAVVALFQADKLIISTAIGAEAVAGYAILGRLFLAAYGVFALILGPLWPAYGDAIRRGDMPWVTRQINRTRLFGCGLMILCGLGMLVLGNWVIGWLSPGTTITVSKNLILAVTAMFAVRAWAESQSIALNSASVFTPQVILFGGHALLNIIVAIAVAKPFGVEGVAWSTSITGLVTSVWGYPWMVRKYITHAKPPGPAARKMERRGFEPVVAAAREES